MPMPSTRMVLRLGVSALGALIVVPVVGEFFIDLAREAGWFDRPTEKVGAVMTFFASPELRLIALFLSGLTLGLWLDWLLRPSSKTVFFSRPQVQPQVQPEERPAIKSTERQFADVTPLFLMNLYEGHTSLQAEQLGAPYLGKWLKVSGPLANMNSPKDTLDLSMRTTNKAMSVTLKTPDDGAYYLKHGLFYFNEDWFDRLKVIPTGTVISFIGQIREFDKFTLYLINCELVH